MKMAFCIAYLWAAFWTGAIAAQLPDAPANPLARISGSAFIGFIWPISLPMHLLDFGK